VAGKLELAVREGTHSVPFLDLSFVHAAVKREILADIGRLIDSGTFVNGLAVGGFEQAFAAYCRTEECVGVASGLDALRLSLLASGLEPGEEVIVPAQTFVATYEAVTQAGGIPVPVDVNESDYGVDVEAVEAAISPRARFAVPVHLYGQMADIRGLQAVLARHGLDMIEDACQAHGASRDGIGAGGAGLAAAFSFYPAKNLGALGDAGALVTNNRELASRACALREHGQRKKYEHEHEGYTARLDTIQALVLLRKLPLLDGWNEQRRRAAAFYTATLAGVGDVRLPSVPAGSRPVWHLYVIRTKDPDRLATFLSSRGIGTGRHYPQPPHLTTAYTRLGYRRGAFPMAEALADEGLSLPIFPGISEAQLSAVVEAVKDFFRHG